LLGINVRTIHRKMEGMEAFGETSLASDGVKAKRAAKGHSL
jgi:hypothetical protein